MIGTIMKKKRKTKRNELKISCEKVHKYGKIKIGEIGDELIYCSPNTGKDVKDEDLISYLKKGLINFIFFNKKKNRAHVHIDMDLDKLDRFVKAAKKRRVYFRKQAKERDKQKKPRLANIFFKHLNSELSFMFRY